MTWAATKNGMRVLIDKQVVEARTATGVWKRIIRAHDTHGAWDRKTHARVQQELRRRGFEVVKLR